MHPPPSNFCVLDRRISASIFELDSVTLKSMTRQQQPLTIEADDETVLAPSLPADGAIEDCIELATVFLYFVSGMRITSCAVQE